MKPVETFWRSIVACALLAVPSAFAAPLITSFEPVSGAPGATITILGSGFDATSANDTVYFGPVRATVTAATASSLTVTVPNGAMFAPITVTVDGGVAYSTKPFEPTFSGAGETLDASSFLPALTVALPAGPCRIAFADINGDGKPDLIIGSIYAHSITILENISTNGPVGSNSFGAPVTFPFVNTAESPYWLQAGDVDGDGNIDLFAPDEAGNRILVYRNVSTGGTITTNSFADPVAFSVGASPRNVALRDIDGDGRPDFAVANIGDQTVSILKNIGTAGTLDTNSFAAQFVLQAGVQPHDLTFGDLDGDGKPDLAVNAYSSPVLSIFRNVSVPGVLDTNSFEARVDLPAPLYCNSVVMADMDGDGKLDLLMVTAVGNNELSVFRNLSTPGSISTNSFGPHVDFPAAGWVDGVAVGDFNGDGKLDVAIVNQMQSTVSLFQNVGTGPFTSASLGPRVDLKSGLNPYSISVIDLDGDGRPELVFNNVYDNTLSILRNVNGIPVPPTITAQPTSRSVAVGATTTFTVTAVGSPTLGYQWWNSAGKISDATNASFTLSGVQTNNAGIYFVVVTNAYGTATTSNATLTVVSNTQNGYPPMITRQPVSRTAPVGSTVSFSILASGSSPVSYQWYGPGINLIPGAVTPTLTLSNVQTSSAGIYFAVVYSPFGYARSMSATLTVTNSTVTITPPTITTQPTNQSVFAGGTASFTVAATGSPVLSCQWYGPTSNVITGAVGATLVVTNVQAGAVGNYFALVSNSGGFAQSSNALLSITPIEASAISQPTISLTVKDGNLDLTWPVWASDFILQSAGIDSPTIWTNVPAIPETNGDNIEVVLPPGQKLGFFRLVHP